MRTISLEELLEAGCHFGHQVNRRNPKADEYIFEARNNVHIINLESTRDGLVAAGKYLIDLASQGGTLLIVGTKRQAHMIVESEVKRAQEAGAKDLFYVTTRWIGGVLTNYQEVSKNFRRLRELEQFLVSGDQGDYTKREVLLMEREKDKLKSLYDGIADLKKIPDAVFIIDTHSEHTAVSEARSMHVPIVGIVDTNADPTVVDRPIPSNDDAVGAIRLITNYLMDAWIEGSDRARKAGEGDRLQALNEEKSEDKGGKDRARKAEEKTQSANVAKDREEKKLKTKIEATAADEKGSKKSKVAKQTNKKSAIKEVVAEASAAVPKDPKKMNTKPEAKK